MTKDSTIAEYLKEITTKVMADSGYPYPEGAKVDPNKAFAYGLAIGTLIKLEQEWRDKC